MTDGQLLLRAVLEDPDSDPARLVYADWLEESGDWEFADFVRRQVANPGETKPYFPRMAPGIFERPPAKVVVRRGFPERVEMPSEEFMNQAADLFGEFPITEVTLTDKTPQRTLPSPRHPILWGWGQLIAMNSVSHLEIRLFCLLTGRQFAADHPWFSPVWKFYDHRWEAINDLSAVCVGLGRNRAGLPPLRPVPALTGSVSPPG